MTTGEMVVDVSQDWVLACEVQQRSMRGHDRTPESVDFSAQCRQVRALGGDCYDFIPLPDDRIALVVGDASGKGLAGALMMASVHASLRTAALFTGSDLAALLRVVNREACASSLADRYATLFYGVCDKAARTLRYVNDGHNPPLLLRADGSVHWLEPSGAPVGMFPDSTWQEKVLTFNPGDCLIACTDGVLEAANQSGEEWGVDGLLHAAAAWQPKGSRGAATPQSAEQLVQWIFTSMDDFSQGCQTDDATVAVLRVME